MIIVIKDKNKTWLLFLLLHIRQTIRVLVSTTLYVTYIIISNQMSKQKKLQCVREYRRTHSKTIGFTYMSRTQRCGQIVGI